MEWFREGKGPVVILVPSEILHDQWYRELEKLLHEFNVKYLLIGSGNNDWKTKNLLEFASSPNQDENIVILSTIQTAKTDQFLQTISDGDHLLVICDEVHVSGAKKTSPIFNIKNGGTLFSMLLDICILFSPK